MQQMSSKKKDAANEQKEEKCGRCAERRKMRQICSKKKDAADEQQEERCSR
jgi:hypothetical protein